MVPEERLILDISYKYNSRKFISFVATAGVGRTMFGIPYLSKYPGNFLMSQLCLFLTPF